ncbi:MAG: leucine-rich repeat protein, partial [Clostridia bacterium]|nr:leucine-rich repeat protein [Clostridia bacterium]
ILSICLLSLTIICLVNLTACDTTTDGTPTHVHSYTEIVIPPTCEVGGYTLYSCDCSDNYTANLTDPLGHAFDNYQYVDNNMHQARCVNNGCNFLLEAPCEDTMPATCTRKNECIFCHNVYGDYRHEYMVYYTNEYLKSPATCCQPAYYWEKCHLCNEIGEQAFPYGDTLPHVFNDYTPNGDATYTSNETETAKCSNQGCIETDTRFIEGTKLISSVSFKTFEQDDNDLYLKVRNETNKFSFDDELQITGVATYFVSTQYGYAVKNAPLHEGENKFILTILINDAEINYNVTIYRNRLIEVSFYSQNEIPSQMVEEGYLVTMPSEQPTRVGYNFLSWAFDFSTPITDDMLEYGNVIINANWEPLTNIKYTVKHYVQNVIGYDFTCVKTESFEGEAGSTVDIVPLDSPHYVKNHGPEQGCVDPEGKAVFELYYKRTIYTYKSNDYRLGEIDDTLPYDSWQAVYGKTVNLTAVPYIGCEFKGWYKNQNFISSNLQIEIEIDGDLVALFEQKAEMSDFYFESDTTNCSIIGLMDDTKTSIVVPEYVTEIDFLFSDNLAYVTFEGNTLIKEDAFSNCPNLTSVEFYKMKNIGAKAFKDCSKLSVVIISDCLEEIGENAFYYCSELTSIYIPATLKTIGKNAFFNCSKLEKITIESLENWFSIDGKKDLLSRPRKLYLDNELITDVVIPNAVTNLGDYAFYNCENLTTINLTENITSIGDYAFCNCKNLTTINLTENITSIGDYAFCNCTLLSNVKLPEQLTHLGASAFMNCKGITKISVPSGVKIIGNSAFKGCDNLEEITLVDGLEDIGLSAFTGCAKISEITIPKTVNVISNLAFENCTSLKQIVIPGNVHTINYGAFMNCTSLESAVLQEGVKYVYGAIFKGCEKLSNVSLPNTISTIYEQTFSDCINLEKITIPNTVTKMEKNVFYGCNNLKEITLPFIGAGPLGTGQKHLGFIFNYEYIKEGNRYTLNEVVPTSLKKVIITNTNVIGKEAFYSCANIEEIILPNNLTVIDDNAFMFCYALKSLTIPKTVTNIGEEAFYNCTSLKELVIPEKVTMIGQGAFRLETSMTSLRFESPLGWRSTNSANDWKNLTNGELIDLSNETNNVSNLNVYGLYLYKTTDNV